MIYNANKNNNTSNNIDEKKYLSTTVYRIMEYIYLS